MRANFFSFLFVFTLLFSAATSARADAEATFGKANADYAAGNFRSAVESYNSLVQERQWNAALFYDLGNAHFRLGDMGRAVLNYERALALAPVQPEAHANLQFVREQSRALELSKNWTEEHLNYLTRDQFTCLGTIAFWAAVFIFCGLCLARRRSVVWVFTLLLLSAIAVGSAFAVYQLETGSNGADLAIVIADKVQARLATAENAGTVLVLPPGSEVKILSQRGQWSYAALPNDLRGWIPATSAERVRL
jgi:tetratricopeptide (TPR) repeat protein